MLSNLSRLSVESRIFRYANTLTVAQFAAQKKLSVEDIADVISNHTEDVLNDVIDGPFKTKPALDGDFGRRTRYSSGRWPVFYGALSGQTAEREVAYHYVQMASPIGGVHPELTYTVVEINFRGEIIDLRPQLEVWPALVSNSYDFCNALGAEAQEVGLGGFLAPSARDTGGTTVPAFQRDTLSEPRVVGLAKFTLGADGAVIQNSTASEGGS